MFLKVLCYKMERAYLELAKLNFFGILLIEGLKRLNSQKFSSLYSVYEIGTDSLTYLSQTIHFLFTFIMVPKKFPQTPDKCGSFVWYSPFLQLPERNKF